MKRILLLLAIVSGVAVGSIDPEVLQPIETTIGVRYELLPAVVSMQQGVLEISVRTRRSEFSGSNVPPEVEEELSRQYIGENAHLVVLWSDNLTDADWRRVGVTLHRSPDSGSDETELLNFGRVGTGERALVCPVNMQTARFYLRFEGQMPLRGFFAVFRADPRVVLR